MPRPNRGPRLAWLAKRGGWYIRWTEAGRSRERSCGTADHGEAQIRLAEFIIESGRNRGSARDPSQYPIVEALSLYAAERGPETAAPDRIAICVDQLLGFWQPYTIGDIDEATCAAYRKHRIAVSDGTVRTDLSCLRAAVRHAHARKRITHAPKVFLPEKPAGRERWLRRGEAAALLWASRKDPRVRLHLPLFILIGLHTGARKGAIMSLRWPQVDFELGRIDFNPPGRRRTKKGRPIIPIPRRLLWFLAKARERGTELGYVLNIDGHPIGNVKHSFATAAIRAGMSRERRNKNGEVVKAATISPHVLRHTAGTWMAQGGISMFDIAGWLGHSETKTTELYAHHSPDFLSEARKVMD